MNITNRLERLEKITNPAIYCTCGGKDGTQPYHIIIPGNSDEQARGIQENPCYTCGGLWQLSFYDIMAEMQAEQEAVAQ